MFNGGFEGPDGQQPSPGNTFGQCNNRQFVPVHGTAQYKDY